MNKKRKRINRENYLKLMEELDNNIYTKKELNELIYEFSSLKSDSETLLKFFEIINVSLSISIIASLLTIIKPKIICLITFMLLFAFIQLLLSLICIKKIMKDINNFNLVIDAVKNKLDKINNTKKRK